MQNLCAGMEVRGQFKSSYLQPCGSLQPFGSQGLNSGPQACLKTTEVLSHLADPESCSLASCSYNVAVWKV